MLPLLKVTTWRVQAEFLSVINGTLVMCILISSFKGPIVPCMLIRGSMVVHFSHFHKVERIK